MCACVCFQRCCSFKRLCVGEYPCNEPGITSLLTSCNPPSCSPALSLCYLNTMNLGVGCMSMQQRVFTVYFATSLKNKGCFVGALFQCLRQLFQSGSHLSQLMVPPVPSHRKWGIRITRGGYEKGHLFHCHRWQSSRRNNRGQEKYWRKRAY